MLETDDHGEVREIRLARPPVNALDPGLVDALTQALQRGAQEARAIVLSGQPGMFSAGLDIKALLELDEAAMLEFWDGFFGLLRALATSPVPVVAAITGHSPAGGAVMAIFCDRRIAAEGDFKIGLNEVQVGLEMPAIIHAGLERLVGKRHAEELSVGGPLLTPVAAQRTGLVDALAPVEEVVPRALDWCNTLLALPPKAMSGTRRHCRRDYEHMFDALGDADREEMNQHWFSEETQATMKAVLEGLGSK